MKRIVLDLSDREAAALEQELTTPRGWGVMIPKPLITAQAKILAALTKENR